MPEEGFITPPCGIAGLSAIRGGLASLLELGYTKGDAGGTLAAGADRIMKEWLQTFASYGAIQNWLQEEYGLGVLPMMCDEARQVVWRQSFT